MKIISAIAAVSLALITSSISLAADTIKIGMTGALSGPAAVLGLDAKAGLEMAIEDINNNGGINGKTVELIAKDDQGEPPKAANFAKQLVYRDEIVAFFPSTMTTPNLASQKITQRAGIPHIIAGTTSNLVCPTREENQPCPENTFRLSITNSWQAEALVNFTLDELKANKVAIIYDVTEYGQDGREKLEHALKGHGVEPVYVDSFNFGAMNFKPLLAKAKEAGAQAILTWTLDFAVARLAIEKKELGYNDIAVLGSSAITGGALRTLGKDAVEGVYIADGMPPVAGSDDAKLNAFVKRYQKTYESDPKFGVPFWTITYYDAMHWLAQKIEEVGTDKSTLTDALMNTGDWSGVNVDYEILPDKRNGRDATTAISIVKVENGELVNP